MIRSRVLTLSAFVQNSQVDLVLPVDFSAILLSYLVGLGLTDDSICKIKDISKGHFSLEELTTAIGSVHGSVSNPDMAA